MKRQVLFYSILFCSEIKTADEGPLYQIVHPLGLSQRRTSLANYRYIGGDSLECHLRSPKLSSEKIEFHCIDRSKRKDTALAVIPEDKKRKRSFFKRLSFKSRQPRQQGPTEPVSLPPDPLSFLTVPASDVVCLPDCKEGESLYPLSDKAPLFLLDRVQCIFGFVQEYSRTCLPWLNSKRPFVTINKIATGELRLMEHSAEGMNPVSRQQALKTVNALVGAAHVTQSGWTLARNGISRIAYTPKGDEEVSPKEALKRIMAGTAKETLHLKICVYLQKRKSDEAQK